MAEDPEVVYISPDRQLTAHIDRSHAAVNADIAAAQFRVNGDGIGIAVIDSGVAAHPDFDKKAEVYQQTFTSGGQDDQFRHGTHVAGIIAGSGHSS